MEEMAISKFKARCLAVLERVRRTGRPMRITRFGKPVAEIVPPTPPKPRGDWIGALRGTARIVGDIVSPVAAEDEWDAVREWKNDKR